MGAGILFVQLGGKTVAHAQADIRRGGHGDLHGAFPADVAGVPEIRGVQPGGEFVGFIQAERRHLNIVPDAEMGSFGIFFQTVQMDPEKAGGTVPDQ